MGFRPTTLRRANALAKAASGEFDEDDRENEGETHARLCVCALFWGFEGQGFEGHEVGGGVLTLHIVV